MSNKAKTGGEAFPRASGGGYGEDHDGMTLRDYFAAKALGGLVASMADEAVRDMMVMNAIDDKRAAKEQVAFAAYEYADEMLRERAK